VDATALRRIADIVSDLDSAIYALRVIQSMLLLSPDTQALLKCRFDHVSEALEALSSELHSVARYNEATDERQSVALDEGRCKRLNE
jgi:hypothetical protein